jgi:phosphatidylethanolamine/phosphatidyl-N-methylethanolamine N-methyltransferase
MSFAFWSALIRDPVAVGAIGPSSLALGQAMLGAADPSSGNVIVEVGAGTGALTRALAGAQGRVIAVEPDRQMAERCRRRCPSVEVVHGRVEDLAQVLHDRGIERIDRVIGGLPYAIWDEQHQRNRLAPLVEHLADDGCLVTFTYLHSPWLPAGRRFRRILGEYFAEVQVSPVVWANLPPAVFYIARGPIRSRTRV